MRGWAAVALEEIADVNPRLAETLAADDAVSFVPMAAVSAESGRVEAAEERQYAQVSKGYTPFRDGDILVAKITPCFENGKVAHATLKHRIGFGSTEFHVVRPNPAAADVRYLLHFLRQEHVRRAGERRMTGSAGQRRVPESFVADLPVPLPPVAEQRRIADVLDRAESLRAKRRDALAQLDTLAESIFLDLFGDPVTNAQQWPVREGATICTRITVGIVVRPAAYYRPSGVPALRSLNIRTNEIVTEDLVYVSAEDNESKLSKTRVQEGDVLVVRSGQPGTAAVVPRGLGGVNAVDIIIATPDRSRVCPAYLCTYLNSQGGRRLVLGAQRGQVQKHLNVSALSAARIPLPPLALQHTFARRIAAVESLKAAHRTSLAELDALFASLQQRAFRGEL